MLHTARLHGILLYRLSHEVWRRAVIRWKGYGNLTQCCNSLPRGGGGYDPQPRDRTVTDRQRSTLNGHTTDEGGNGLYKGWNPRRIISYEESLKE